MWASGEVTQVRVHKGGRGGGDLRPAFIRAFTMAYRMIGHPWKDKWIVGVPEKMDPAKRNAGVISE